MNVEIGTETPIFLFWEYLFRNFGILSLQCGSGKQFTLIKNIQHSSGVHRGSKGGGLKAGLGCLIDLSAACLGGAVGLALPWDVGVVLSIGWGAVTGLALPREVGVALSQDWDRSAGLTFPWDVGVSLSIGWGDGSGCVGLTCGKGEEEEGGVRVSLLVDTGAANSALFFDKGVVDVFLPTEEWEFCIALKGDEGVDGVSLS